MRIIGIYKIQSIIKPERIYIGSANNMDNRWWVHLNDLRKNKHHSIQLQRHYNKYGEADLVFIIIEPCLPVFLLIREQYYIDTFKPYFNTCKTAGSNLGLKASEETKRKMSESRIGEKNHWYKKHPSEESRKKMSLSRIGNKNCIGRIYSIETRKKMSIAAKNKPKISEETRNKMSISRKKYFDTIKH